MSEVKIMLGNEAIARGAYEAGVKVSAAYSSTTCPALCNADFAAFICDKISSHGTSSSTILSIASGKTCIK